jgi:hypothetical protein
MQVDRHEMLRITASARALVVAALRRNGELGADTVRLHEKGIEQHIAFPSGHIAVAVERSAPPSKKPHVVLRVQAADVAGSTLTTAHFVLGPVGTVMKIKDPQRLQPEDALLNDDGTYGAWIDLNHYEGDIHVRHIDVPLITTGRRTFSALIGELFDPAL